MTLYIKGTDTVIVGTLEHLSGIGVSHGLDDDGSIIWSGDTKVGWDDQYTEFHAGLPVWVDDDGDCHQGVQVEDRREDGTVVDYTAPWREPVRPVTKQILALWRHQVANFQTTDGAESWGESLTIKDWLSYHGLLLAERDPYINEKSSGAWQVTEAYDKLDHPEPDASKLNFFAIVGDDADDLLAEAIDWINSGGE